MIKKLFIESGVGERLREERDRLGLNQTDFGVAAGVSRGTQKAYELESSSPDIRYLSTLQGMEVDVLYVLTGERSTMDADGLTAEEAKVLEQYRTMSPESRASVERVAEALANYKI